MGSALGVVSPSTELLMDRLNEALSMPQDATDIDDLLQAQVALAATRELLSDLNEFGKAHIQSLASDKLALQREIQDIRTEQEHEKERLINQTPPELFGELKHENALLRQDIEARTKTRNAMLKKAINPNLPAVQTNYSRRRKDMPAVKRSSADLAALQEEIILESPGGKTIENFRQRYDSSILQLQAALRAELGRQVGCDNLSELDLKAPAALLRLADVLYPSNKRYLQYYFKVYRTIRHNEEHDLEGLNLDIKDISVTGRKYQIKSDGLELMIHAIKLKKQLEDFMAYVELHTECKSVATQPKSFYRMVERAAAHDELCHVDKNPKDKEPPLAITYKYDDCCSFLRGRLIGRSMKDLREALKSILAYRDQDAIIIDYVRDRFGRPTPAGWRDLILGFHFMEDNQKHILEVQLVHEMYATVAEELGGEDEYDKGRAVVEGLAIACRATSYGNMTSLVSFHCNVLGREIALSKTLMSDDPWAGWGQDSDVKNWEGIIWRSDGHVDVWATAIRFLGRYDDEAYRALSAYGLPPSTQIDLTTNRPIVNDDILSVICEYSVDLLSVDVSGCTKITAVGIKDMASYCRHLQLVNLANCHLVSDEAIECLASSCGNSLESIELMNIKVRLKRY